MKSEQDIREYLKKLEDEHKMFKTITRENTPEIDDDDYNSTSSWNIGQIRILEWVLEQ
jgi:hypothetical protein